MFKDDQSIQVFLRMHEREAVVDQAHHVADPVEDLSAFAGHARSDRAGGLLIVVIGVAIIAALGAVYLNLV